MCPCGILVLWNIKYKEHYVTLHLVCRLLHSSLWSFNLSVHYIQGAEKDMDTFCTVNFNFNLIRQSKAEHFLAVCGKLMSICLKKTLFLRWPSFLAFHTCNGAICCSVQQEFWNRCLSWSSVWSWNTWK